MHQDDTQDKPATQATQAALAALDRALARDELEQLLSTVEEALL